VELRFKGTYLLKFSVFGKWVSMDELIFALIAFVGFACVFSHLFVLLDVLKLGITPLMLLFIMLF